MRKIIVLTSCFLALFLVFGCSSVTDGITSESTATSALSQNTGSNLTSGSAYGADLSWVTQMEASGYKWYNTSGTQQDIFAICKGLGMNSVRLRVWVNPSGGWCNQADTVAKAKRAAAQGMGVYLTFHLSDTWADPGDQNPPAAWASHSYSQMCTDVYNHIDTVVTAVKAVATVGWVSVGNETSNGCLWPTGNASSNPTQYAGLITSGYNAAHAAGCGYVGVHLANVWDTATWQWNFGILNSDGGKYDFCGGSLYPTTSNYSTLISEAKTTASKMSKPTVIAEFGIDQGAGTTGYAALQSAKTICSDLFYWEPECYGGWQGYTMGAFTSAGEPGPILIN